MKRNLKQWVNYLLGIRKWNHVSTDTYYLFDQDQYKMGQFNITHYYCQLSNCSLAITHNEIIYENPM
jgi:hypothetical protein